MRIDTCRQDGRTPLHWAATSGSLEIVRLLLDHKAEVDAADNGGWTPFLIAGSVSGQFWSQLYSQRLNSFQQAQGMKTSCVSF